MVHNLIFFYQIAISAKMVNKFGKIQFGVKLPKKSSLSKALELHAGNLIVAYVR